MSWGKDLEKDRYNLKNKGSIGCDTSIQESSTFRYNM